MREDTDWTIDNDAAVIQYFLIFSGSLLTLFRHEECFRTDIHRVEGDRNGISRTRLSRFVGSSRLQFGNGFRRIMMQKRLLRTETGDINEFSHRIVGKTSREIVYKSLRLGAIPRQCVRQSCEKLDIAAIGHGKRGSGML